MRCLTHNQEYKQSEYCVYCGIPRERQLPYQPGPMNDRPMRMPEVSFGNSIRGSIEPSVYPYDGPGAQCESPVSNAVD